MVEVVASITAMILGFILAYAYFHHGGRGIQTNIAKISYVLALIWYVKLNTVGSWLGVFRFSILDQFSSPRKLILFILPITSPWIGIVTLYAIS